jgi:hypothetical protein
MVTKQARAHLFWRAETFCRASVTEVTASQGQEPLELSAADDQLLPELTAGGADAIMSRTHPRRAWRSGYLKRVKAADAAWC